MAQTKIDLMDLFQRIKWASSGTIHDMSKTNYNWGWAYLGDDKPTVQDFNFVQQKNDEKDIWLFNQINEVLKLEGITASEDEVTSLRDAIKGMFDRQWCESIAQLRTIEPTEHNQRILVRGYYAGSNVGGGEFYADFNDKTTDDNGGTVIVTTSGKRWKRIYTEITPFDFGAKADETTDDTLPLMQIAKLMPSVNLLANRYKVTAVPSGGNFINGSMLVNGDEVTFGLFPIKKQGFRVGCWNIWGAGSTNKYFDGEKFNSERMFELKVDLAKIGADIIGLQEVYWNNVACKTDRYLVGTYKSTYQCSWITRTNNDQYGCMNLGPANIEALAKNFDVKADSVDAEQRGYVKTVYQIGNKTVALFNTHCTLSDARRAAMFDELQKAVLADKSDVCFLLGDFNVPNVYQSPENWKPYLSNLLNAGFKMVNNGSTNTFLGGKGGAGDDILYKGCELVQWGLHNNTRLGDHSCIYADFNF